METGIHNTSEIGRLKKVLLHRPGGELENLMPEYLERLLFDDIPYLKEAQREHDAFADCLRGQGVEVVYLTDLVAESLTDADVRRELIRQFLEESGVRDDRLRDSLEDYLSALPDKEMVSAMMAGVRKSQLRTGSARLGDYLAAGDDYPFAVTRCPTSTSPGIPSPPSAPACPSTRCTPSPGTGRPCSASSSSSITRITAVPPGGMTGASPPPWRGATS